MPKSALFLPPFFPYRCAYFIILPIQNPSPWPESIINSAIDICWVNNVDRKYCQYTVQTPDIFVFVIFGTIITHRFIILWILIRLVSFRLHSSRHPHLLWCRAKNLLVSSSNLEIHIVLTLVYHQTFCMHSQCEQVSCCNHIINAPRNKFFWLCLPNQPVCRTLHQQDPSTPFLFWEYFPSAIYIRCIVIANLSNIASFMIWVPVNLPSSEPWPLYSQSQEL